MHPSLAFAHAAFTQNSLGERWAELVALVHGGRFDDALHYLHTIIPLRVRRRNQPLFIELAALAITTGAQDAHISGVISQAAAKRIQTDADQIQAELLGAVISSGPEQLLVRMVLGLASHHAITDAMEARRANRPTAAETDHTAAVVIARTFRLLRARLLTHADVHEIAHAWASLADFLADLPETRVEHRRCGLELHRLGLPGRIPDPSHEHPLAAALAMARNPNRRAVVPRRHARTEPATVLNHSWTEIRSIGDSLHRDVHRTVAQAWWADLHRLAQAWKAAAISGPLTLDEDDAINRLVVRSFPLHADAPAQRLVAIMRSRHLTDPDHFRRAILLYAGEPFDT